MHVFFGWEEWSLFKFNNSGMVRDMALKFKCSLAKRSRLKVRKLEELIPAFREVL